MATPEEDVLSFLQMQYAAIGFVGVVFTHDFWLTVGLTLVIAATTVFPAFWLEIAPTFLYVYSVRLTLEILAGAVAAAVLVYALSLPRLIHGYSLLPGVGERRTDRVSVLTLHAIFVILIFFFAVISVIGVYYWTGAYDSPTLGLFIGDATTLNLDQAGPFLTIGGAVIVLSLLILMTKLEHTGIGAISAKYIVALIALLAPASAINLSESTLDATTAGGVGVGVTFAMWVLFYFWARAVAFKPGHTKMDALYHNSKRTLFFILTTGVVHVVALGAGYGIDIGFTTVEDRFVYTFYTGLAGAFIVLLVGVIIMACSGRVISKSASRHKPSKDAKPLLSPKQERRRVTPGQQAKDKQSDLDSDGSDSDFESGNRNSAFLSLGGMEEEDLDDMW